MFIDILSPLTNITGFFDAAGLPPKRNSTLSSRQATEIFEKYRNSFKHYLQVNTIDGNLLPVSIVRRINVLLSLR